MFAPEDIPDTKEFIELWQTLARENGLKGIYFVARLSSVGMDYLGNKDIETVAHDRYQKYLDLGYDAVNSDMQRYAQIKVAGLANRAIKSLMRKYVGNVSASLFDYEKIMNNFYIEEEKREEVHPQIIPRLDRTPRSGKDARVYTDSTPEKFGNAIESALDIVKNKNPEHRILFLQAWNEWGEGNYMEPDLKFGRGYLEILKDKITM